MDPPELTCSFIIEINISLLSLSRYVEGSSKIHTLAGQNDNLSRLNLLYSPADNQDAGQSKNISKENVSTAFINTFLFTDQISLKNSKFALTVNDPLIASKWPNQETRGFSE